MHEQAHADHGRKFTVGKRQGQGIGRQEFALSGAHQPVNPAPAGAVAAGDGQPVSRAYQRPGQLAVPPADFQDGAAARNAGQAFQDQAFLDPEHPGADGAGKPRGVAVRGSLNVGVNTGRRGWRGRVHGSHKSSSS